jgi:5-hydroxyisourate hydrolase
VAQGAHPGAPTISTHVLDTERGAPAVGVRVTLYRLSDDGRPLRLTQALTDADGRVPDMLERPMVVGTYRLEFDLADDADDADEVEASRAKGAPARLFRRVSLDLQIADATRSYHVPLLLAPFSLTTYRGS